MTFYGQLTFRCTDRPHVIDLFISGRAFGLCPPFDCSLNVCVKVLVWKHFLFLGCIPGMELLDRVVELMFNFEEPPNCSPKGRAISQPRQPVRCFLFLHVLTSTVITFFISPILVGVK